MNCTLIGFKSVEFDTKDGDTVEGVKVFFAYPEQNTYGNYADGVFVSKKVFDSFNITFETLSESIGCAVDIEFNRFGKITNIKCPEKQ